MLHVRGNGNRWCVACAIALWLVPARSAAPQAALPDTPLIAGEINPTSFLPTTVPYQLWNGLVVVTAVLQDGLPQRAVISTGLPACVLSPRVAAQAGVKPSGTIDLLTLDRTIKMPSAGSTPIRVGQLSVRDVTGGITDLYLQFSASSQPDAPGVWLGNSFLAATTFTVDPTKQEVTFRRPTDPPPSKAIVVPFELKSGRIWVDVKVNGKKSFPAILDTSSIGTFLPAKVAQELGLTAVATLPATLPNGKDGKVAVTDLSEVAIGECKAEGVQALYVADGPADAIDPGFAVIGGDVLLRYRLTVSYRDRKLYLQRLPQPKPPAAPKGNAQGTGAPGSGVRP